MVARTIAALVKHLTQRGVTLTLVDGQIRYSGPPDGCATDELLELKSRRAEAIAYLESNKRAETVLPIGSYVRTFETPLSSSQRWWWDLEKITGPQPHPVIPIQLSRDTDESLLRRALTAVVNKHEALRTRFVSEAYGEMFTVIDSPGEVELENADFTSLADEVARDAAAAFMHRFRLETYRLNGGALYRTCLVKVTSEHWVLLVGVHHSIVDAWSFGILRTELSAAYAALSSGATWESNARTQLADFCIWEQHWLRSSGRDDPYEYWDRTLASATALQLPTDYPRTEQIFGFPEGRCELNVSPLTLSGLRALGQRYGTSMLANILGVYGLVLARWSMRSDILFGNYTVFRWPLGAADLIGCLGANRPVLLRFDTTATFPEYLEHVRAAYAVSLDFQKVVSAGLAWRQHLNRTIANLSISASDQQIAEGSPPGWQALPINHELALVLQAGPNSLRGFVSYAASLFLPSTIQWFCREFERLAAAVGRDPTQRLAELIPEIATFRSQGDA